MHKYKNLIFVDSWDDIISSGQLKDVELVIDKMAKMEINIFILAAPYRYNKNPIPNFYRNIYFDSPFDINIMRGNDKLMAEANSRLNLLSTKYTNVYFIDRELLYTKENKFDVDGVTVPYTFDGGHISIIGSKYSAKHFLNLKGYNDLMKHFTLN